MSNISWPCSSVLRPTLGVLLAGIFGCMLIAQASDVPKVALDACDLEWERLKSLPPISKETWDDLVVGLRLDATGKPVGRAIYRGVDIYYYLARVPFVVGLENTPSATQREDWLRKAAALGHKAAKATLLRQQYLDKGSLALGDRPTREQALLATLEAAEAGDPEFATILMDTARNVNGGWLCRPEDRTNAKAGGCNPQSVVKPIETRKWAEKAALGGNSNAKLLLCRHHVHGTYPDLGFYKNDALAIQWCFATAHSACASGSGASLLVGLYQNGVAIRPDLDRAKAWDELARRAYQKSDDWPYTSK